MPKPLYRSGVDGCGTCAIGAYNQAKMDLLIGVDGDNEFTIYAAPVGRLSRPRLTKIGLGSLSLAQADLALADLVCLG